MKTGRTCAAETEQGHEGFKKNNNLTKLKLTSGPGGSGSHI